MTNWTSEELNKIGNAAELEIATLRGDGSMRKSRTIWVVRVGDDLYVRSVNGRGSDWFRGTQARQAGHIQAGGVDRDVAFMEEAGPDLQDQIDAAYHTKYHHYAASIVNSVLTPQARSATLKLLPH